MRRLARAAVLACGLSSCTLLTQLDGLSGGTAPGGDDGSTDGPGDGPARDADAPSDAATGDGSPFDRDAGQICGAGGPTDGLLAYWAFDEGMGNTVHDCSGHGHDGTFVHAAPSGGSWANGKKGGALQVRLSDTTGCVDLGMPAALRAPTMTAAMWINVDGYPSKTSGATGYFIGQTMNANTDGWRIGSRTDSDAGAFEVGWEHTVAGTHYVCEGAGPPTGAWHHVAVTFAPNASLEVFVDGVSAQVVASIPPINPSTTANLRIGCRADDANYFDGRIDELRLYGRVLAGSEIAKLAAP